MENLLKLFNNFIDGTIQEGDSLILEGNEYQLRNRSGVLFTSMNRSEFALKCKEHFFRKGYRLASEYFDELPMGSGVCKISQKSGPDSKNYTHLWTKFGEDETTAILNACLFLLEQGVE